MSHPFTWPAVAVGSLPTAVGNHMTFVRADGYTCTTPLGDFLDRTLMTASIAWMTGALTGPNDLAANDAVMVWDNSASKMVPMSGPGLRDATLLSQDLSAVSTVTAASLNGASDRVLVGLAAGAGVRVKGVNVSDLLSLAGFNKAAAAPTTGAHTVNELVFNNAPVAGGFLGWVCVTAGTPGTWKQWGMIEE